MTTFDPPGEDEEVGFFIPPAARWLLFPWWAFARVARRLAARRRSR